MVGSWDVGFLRAGQAIGALAVADNMRYTGVGEGAVGRTSSDEGCKVRSRAGDEDSDVERVRGRIFAGLVGGRWHGCGRVRRRSALFNGEGSNAESLWIIVCVQDVVIKPEMTMCVYEESGRGRKCVVNQTSVRGRAQAGFKVGQTWPHM